MSTAPSPPAVAPAWRGDLKVATVLAVSGAIAAALLFPYLLQLMPERFARLPVPLWIVVAAQSLQALVLLGLLSFAGLRMGRRVGLGAPLLDAWLNGRPHAQLALHAVQAALLGVAAAAAVLALARLLDPMLPAPLHPPAHPPAGHAAFNGLLASFYGGIVEELQLRLFLMTLLIWLVAWLRKSRPGAATYVAALALAALVFGIGHLPAAAQVWGLDGWVVARTVALNTLAGVVFGWLYWKRGLEIAMVSHFCADLVLHAASPLMAGAT